jgi:hypothetical protein
MRKLIFALSTLACGAGLYLISWALRPVDLADTEGPFESQASTALPSLDKPRAAVAPKYTDFPIGQTRVVDLEADAPALDQMTPREQRDQFRDWLLFAVLSSAGLGPEHLNQSLYDVPSVRHGYMKSVANFEYGESRSCSIGQGQILALIPTGGGPHRDALLAEIADGHRKNLGTEPRTISVVEYDLDAESQSARLTRQQDIDGRCFFTEEKKYHHAAVHSLEELRTFLANIDDITFASLESGSLVLGGRKVVDHDYRGVSTEDVAAIWQAEDKLHKALGQFDNWVSAKQRKFDAGAQAEFDALRARWDRKVERINARLTSGDARLKSPYDYTPQTAANVPKFPEMPGPKLSGSTKSPGDKPAVRPPGQSDDDFETASVIDENAIRLRQDEEFKRLEAAQRAKWTAVANEVEAERDRRRLVNGSGFSLDPNYDFEGLSQFVERLVRELDDYGAGKGPLAIPAQELTAIIDALKRNDLAPFRALLDRLETADNSFARMLYDELRSAKLAIRSTEGDVDVEGMSRILGRLETELDALAQGRWPDGSASDFGPARKALAAGDQTLLQAWLGRMKAQDGPLAQSMWQFISYADERYHGRSINDRGGLDAWLSRLEAEVKNLTTGPGSSTVAAELQQAVEAVERADDGPCTELINRWKSSNDLLASSLGEALAALVPGYKHRGRLDQNGLKRLLLRVDRGLKSLVSGDEAALSFKSIRQVRAALARGDDAPFRKMADRLIDSKDPVALAVGTRLELATTRFRVCDFRGLASFLGEVGVWSNALVAGDSRAASAASIRKLRETLKPTDATALWYLTNWLRASGNKIAAMLADELHAEADAYLGDDCQKLAPTIDTIGKELRELPTVLPLRELRAAAQAMAAASNSAQARGKEAEQAVVPLLSCADRLRNSQNATAVNLGVYLEHEFNRYRFQMARYDGELKGTEVGMVLFYTDLLAKLWALDYMHNQPGREIDDFHSMTDLKISPVFEEEIRKLPNTRLWFGHEDKGFQVATNGNSLMLARAATRIYAASSNPLAPGAEVPATASSEAFLGWWNDHYLDVARYEPQYERLNEIMKWSLLISWLNEKGQGNALSFLERLRVDHSQWFPDWVRTRPDLRFHRWDTIAVFEPGYKGSTTETLPLLTSEGYVQFGSVHTLSGGVSLAPKELFRNRAGLGAEVNPLIRRSNLNYAARSVSGQGQTFKTLQESQYTFRPISSWRAAMEAVPRAGTALRGRVAEIKTPKFERTVTTELRQWEIAAKVGDHDLATLKVQPTQNGLAVGLRSRELAVGHSLARRASTSFDRASALAHHAKVEAVVDTPSAVFVRVRGSKSWLKLEAANAGPGAKSAEGSVARVADTKVGARPYDLSFVDASVAKAAVAKSESIAIEIPASTGSGLTVRVLARGPPANAAHVQVAIEWEGATLRGQFDPQSGILYMKTDALPTALLDQPSLVQSVIQKSGVGRLQAGAGKSGPIRLAAKDARFAESRLMQEIEEGQFRSVAEELAQEPGVFARRLKKDYESTLRHCDELLADGQHERALGELATLEDVFGTRPEVRFRQAVAEIGAGRSAHGARLAREAMEAPRADLAKLFEEINLRLSDPRLEPGTRINLSRLRDAATWRDIKAVGKASTGDIALISKAGRLEIELHIKQELALLESASAERVLKSDAPVYIQDSPGLNNLDWSASFPETLRGLIQGDLVNVMSVADVGIAEFRPTRIFTGVKPSTSAISISSGYSRVRPLADSVVATGLRLGSVLAPRTSNQDEEEKARKRRIAAILSGRNESANEVFVIVPKVKGQ